jgi:VanZ family protein
MVAERPWSLIFVVFSILLFLAALAPNTLTGDIGEIRRQIRKINVIPFSRSGLPLRDQLGIAPERPKPSVGAEEEVVYIPRSALTERPPLLPTAPPPPAAPTAEAPAAPVPEEAPPEERAPTAEEFFRRQFPRKAPVLVVIEPEMRPEPVNFYLYWGGLLKHMGMFAIFGFGAFCAFREWPPTRLRMLSYMISSVVLAFVFAVIIEFAKVFVIGARIDVTFVIVALLGAFVGAGFGWRCSERFYQALRERVPGEEVGAVEGLGLEPSTIWWAVNLVIFFNFFVILYDNLVPFEFSGTLRDAWNRLNFVNLVPFWPYFWKTWLPIVIKDWFNVLAIYVPFGFLLYYNRVNFMGNHLWESGMDPRKIEKLRIMSGYPPRYVFDRQGAHLAGLLAILVGVITEFPQNITNGRITDLTDVVNGWLGTWAGCVMCHALFYYRDKFAAARRKGVEGIREWREELHERARAVA